MFKLFKSKPKVVPVTHHVYLSQTELYRQLIGKVIKSSEASNRLMLVYHFNETGVAIRKLLEAAQVSFGAWTDPIGTDSNVLLIESKKLRQFSKIDDFSTILFSEIHPIGGVDVEFNELLKAKNVVAEIVFYVSMDSPILSRFGAEKIIDMMNRLGMKENEKIEHKMIDTSILRAQERLKELIVHEKEAESIQEWMDFNATEIS